MAEGVNVAQLMVTVGANTAMAEQGIMGLARMLAPGGLLGLGAVAAGLAVAGIGVAAVKMAGDFQTSLTQLVTGAGESQANLKMISDGVLQMARDTGTSTGQLTSGLYMIESAGIHGAAALDILKAAAEGAKVGNADLGTVADAVTTVMKDYGSTGITASEATNTLIATVANGKTHMQDLAGALANVLPTAQAAGVGLNDVMAAMAAQTAAGVPAADAATHLRQMILALVAPSSAAKKALEGVGLSTDQVAAEMKVSLPDAIQMITDAVGKKFPPGSAEYVAAIKNISGGIREMQGVMVLSGTHMADFQGDVGKISAQVKAGGASIDGWNLVQGTFNQKMSQLGELFQTVMITLGQKLLPVATQFVGFLVSSLTPAITALTTPVQTVTGHFARVAEHFQNTGSILQSTLLPAFQQLAQFAQTTVVPMFQQLAGFLEANVVPALTQLADFVLANVVPAVEGLVGFFRANVLPILETFVKVLLQDVLPAILPVVKVILTQWLPPLERIMTAVLPVLNPLLQALGWVIGNVVGPALLMAAELVGGLLSVTADMVELIIKAFTPAFQAAGLVLQRVIMPAVQPVIAAFKQFTGGIGDLLGAIGAFIHNPSVTNLVQIMKDIANAGTGVTNVLTSGVFSKFLPHFAEGGVMTNTGVALVGEAGPELVNLPGGATITPLTNLNGSLAPFPASGGYGGYSPQAQPQPITINQTITLDGQTVARQVVRYLPDIVRNSTGTRHM